MYIIEYIFWNQPITQLIISHKELESLLWGLSLTNASVVNIYTVEEEC